ncbi:MAG: (Fe-S)-binding protein [Actinomycetota bacterium]
MDLRLDADELNSCVQCGLCLPHCPTYRVTGDETLSPRGRIRLMREVQDNGAPVTPEIVEAFDTCVQCRGCEPACPSGVPYGHLIESTREQLVTEGSVDTRRQRLAFWALSKPRTLRFGSFWLAIAARLRLVPKRFGVPTDLPLRRRSHNRSGDDVYLFTGCVMDAWQRDVHQAGQRVLEAAGVGVTPTADLAPCCGALHTHAGLGDDARRRAEATMAALAADDRPILVDSAGCGAAMKEYGHLLGTAEAEAFSARVYDIQEWLADRIDDLPSAAPLDLCVAVQDPCHQRHVQRVHVATRTVLAPFVHKLIELDDDGLCCGAGGAYSVLHPQLAGDIRTRKIDAIDRTSPDVVASANPGCSMHLAAGGVDTVHPMQLIDRALHQAE